MSEKVQLMKNFNIDNFCSRFWHTGRWIKVVVDDLLPSRHGESLFITSNFNDEFWAAMTEKAFAKLHGSYDYLARGSFSEAMVSFTGGCPEVLEPRTFEKNKLFERLLDAYQQGSHIGCTTPVYGRKQILAAGKTYIVTKVLKVTKGNRDTHRLIRLRKPWSDEMEWLKTCSEFSGEWSAIPEEDKNDLGLTVNEDAREFWMSLDDFARNFQTVEFCHTNAKLVADFDGQFNEKAGYFIEVKAKKAVTIISLSHLIQRSGNIGKSDPFIGFEMYSIRKGKLIFSTNLKPTRDVTQRIQLGKGRYQIVPNIVNGNGNFYLRIFSDQKMCAEKITDD